MGTVLFSHPPGYFVVGPFPPGPVCYSCPHFNDQTCEEFRSCRGFCDYYGDVDENGACLKHPALAETFTCGDCYHYEDCCEDREPDATPCKAFDPEPDAWAGYFLSFGWFGSVYDFIAVPLPRTERCNRDASWLVHPEPWGQILERTTALLADDLRATDRDQGGIGNE